MQILLITVPIVISLCNCIFTLCLNKKMSNRIQQVQDNLTVLIHTHTHQYNPVPPPPSIPSGYGYKFYPGDPNNQGLNIV